jgi:hypothetical protein
MTVSVSSFLKSSSAPDWLAISQESRIHKFILRTYTSCSELDISAMENLGVKVRRAEYVAEGDGAVLMLVQLVEKMRRVDIMQRLFGGETKTCDFPYNSVCATALKIEESRGVQMLVSSGRTKEEYQRVFAQHFVSTGGGGVKRKKESDDEDSAVPPNLCQMLDQWGTRFLERVGHQRDQELLTLREENARLKKSEAPTAISAEDAKRMQEQIKELETANARLLAKKDSFDRLTASYASWRYDLKCKDAHIAALETRTKELDVELAKMTERRDALVARVEAQEKELGVLRSRRQGGY